MKKMYVLMSRQLEYSKPYVQGAHALANFSLEFPEEFKEWNNHTLVFLGCKDIEKERFLLKNKLSENISSFNEPDYDNRLTAICVYTDSKIMEKYSLL